MRCEFFYGSSRQCIAKKCVEEESRVRKMEPGKGSSCFGCPYRKPEGYCFPCMKKMLERKREKKLIGNRRKKGMDKHIEVIGIDHGWSNMKTVSQIFTTGVKEIATEPAFFDNIVEWNGTYKLNNKL